jgi:hypothetical protein
MFDRSACRLLETASKLADTLTPTESQIQAALDIFRAAGCRAR